jgi:hypothetical protein
MAHFNLAEYQTVQERIDLLKQTYPESRIVNKMIHIDENNIIVECSIYLRAEDTEPTCVDLAHEVKDSSPVNRTSWVENCTTSSTGRSISLLGGAFSPKGKRPSREEMAKVQRANNAAQITAIDVQKTATLKELEALWSRAVDSGDSTKLIAEFTARKKHFNEQD